MPADFDERGLPQVLEQHTRWVEERLLHLSTQPLVPNLPPSTIALPAIDEQWRVEYLLRNGGRNSCREYPQSRLLLSAATDEQSRELLKRWLSRKAKAQLVPWLQETSEELALPFSGVTIRGQRTRWGSCSAKGHINLNYALLFLQPDLVRYLFVHELCHTVHLNHSRHYWNLVQSLEPHYRTYEKALKLASNQVPPWLHNPFQQTSY